MKKELDFYQFPPVTLPQHNFILKAPEFGKNREDFTIWFLEGILERNPNYIDCLTYLGNAYTTSGRYQEGLKIDQRLARLRPGDPIVQYNLACSYSLAGDINSAIATLEKAIALGYKDIHHVERDRDLENLRKHKRYQELITRTKRALKVGKEKGDV